MIKIIDAATGQEIDREMTDEELDQLKSDQAKAKADRAKEEAEAETKAQAKATAEGKLAALGLTTNDLKALGL